MTSLNGEQFRMQPNLKAKPGSQGTLFQGGKPVDEHRYQRGYTPQRMRDVTAALTRTYTSEGRKQYLSYDDARAAGAPEHEVAAREKEAPGQGYWHTPVHTVIEHTIKDPAEQLAARKNNNRMTCPTCKGGGIIPEETREYPDYDGGTVNRTIPAEHCWDCGGRGSPVPEGGVPGVRDQKGKGYRSMRDVVREDSALLDKAPEAGKTGIWDETEIVPKGHTHPFLNPQGALHIREAIARSTVPIDDISLEKRRVRRIRVSNNPEMKRANAVGHAMMGEIGLETRPPGTYVPGWDTHKGQMKDREQAAGTLIHELGHTSGAMGTEHDNDEARADAYMLQHYRPDPRNVRSGAVPAKGPMWLYSRKAGDSLDPDNVHAPGETDAMKQERLVRAPASNFRTSRNVVAGRPGPKQETLW